MTCDDDREDWDEEDIDRSCFVMLEKLRAMWIEGEVNRFAAIDIGPYRDLQDAEEEIKMKE